jgi:hypothetical protein
MYCSICGSENVADAKFCRECGFQIIADPPKIVEKVVIREKIIAPKSKKWLWIAFSIISLISVILLIILINKPDENNSDSISPVQDENTIVNETVGTAKIPYSPTKSDVKELFISKSTDLDGDDYSVEKDELKIDLGDLNNDGLSDAIVDFSFYSNTGGNANLGGGFMVFINDGEKITYKSWMETSNLKLDYVDEHGKIKATRMEYGENDPRCCPSISTSVDFKYENGKLIEI